MPSVEIEIEDRAGVRRLTLDRAEKKNALTAAMYLALGEAIASADDDNVGAILLDARGDTFCAGNDLRDFLAAERTETPAPFAFLLALAQTDVPIVAAVQGPAIGIGTTMLLHCDLVYATPSARFRLPFVQLGLVPEAGSSVLLPRLLGRARAGAALYLSETLDAETALRDGLVTAIVADDELADRAQAAAGTVAAQPRAAVRATKRLVQHDRDAIVEAIRREGDTFGERLASEEARTAMAAFFPRAGNT